MLKSKLSLYVSVVIQKVMSIYLSIYLSVVVMHDAIPKTIQRAIKSLQ